MTENNGLWYKIKSHRSIVAEAFTQNSCHTTGVWRHGSEGMATYLPSYKTLSVPEFFLEIIFSIYYYKENL